MPHHADPPVARITAGLAASFVASAGLGYSLAQLRRPQGLSNRHLNGVKLMVTRHLLDQHAAAVILEHDEVAHQRKETVATADALQHHL